MKLRCFITKKEIDIRNGTKKFLFVAKIMKLMWINAYMIYHNSYLAIDCLIILSKKKNKKIKS